MAKIHWPVAFSDLPPIPTIQSSTAAAFLILGLQVASEQNP
jgi:hypothetical protein